MLRKGLADLTEDASSRPISFWVNRFLAPRIAEAWIRIRFENEVADRCLSTISRRDRLGSRDRGRLSEAIFTALRRRGTVDRIVGFEAASEREQSSQWLATALEQTWPDGPEPLPFNESQTPEEAGNLPPLVIEKSVFSVTCDSSKVESSPGERGVRRPWRSCRSVDDSAFSMAAG